MYLVPHLQLLEPFQILNDLHTASNLQGELALGKNRILTSLSINL